MRGSPVSSRFEFLSPTWALQIVARDSTYYYAQLRNLFQKMPEEQIRFMAIFINSRAEHLELPDDMIRSMVATWAKHNWSFLCYRYAALFVNIVKGDGTIDDSLVGMIKHGRTIGSVIEHAMGDVKNGSTRFKNRILELSPDDYIRMVEKSLPPERCAEAWKIILKAIESDQ